MFFFLSVFPELCSCDLFHCSALYCRPVTRAECLKMTHAAVFNVSQPTHVYFHFIVTNLHTNAEVTAQPSTT